MTQEHPITPPPELVRHWSRFQGDTDPEALWFRIANEAAQWGADQELDACCMEIIDGAGLFYIDETGDRVRLTEDIRATRRPKPLSLKEQALLALNKLPPNRDCGVAHDTIRRALEQLPDNE